MRNEHIGLRLILTLAFFLVAGYASANPGMAALDSPASLTINVYTCDNLHDPIEPNATLLNECALGTEDIPFTLQPVAPQGGSMMASTGAGGTPATISFSNLPSGDYRLIQGASDAIVQSYIAECASNVRKFDTPFSPFAIVEPDGRLNIELLPDEQLTCDWYNILAPEQATATTLSVTVYSCSGDVIDPAICDLAPNVDLRLFNPSAEVILTSDVNGVATFDGEGTFQIEPVSELDDRVFCAFEPATSTATDELTLDSSNPVTLDAFFCYPGA